MLVLSRKLNQDIYIPLYGITLKVVRIRGGEVRIGIEAPKEIKVIRGELREFPDKQQPKEIV